MWIEADRAAPDAENSGKHQHPHHLPAILTVGEAARLLRVSTDTIYRWSSQNQLRGIASRGQPLRLKRDKLIEWFFNRHTKRRRRRSIRGR